MSSPPAGAKEFFAWVHIRENYQDDKSSERAVLEDSPNNTTFPPRAHFGIKTLSTEDSWC